MKSNTWIGWIAAVIAVIAVLILGAQAFAAIATPEGETGLSIRWGETGAIIISSLGAVLASLVGVVVGILPGPARWAIKLAQIDQVIEKAILAAAAKYAEEVKKKGWTGDLRFTVARDAAVIALNSGNKFVLQSRDTLADKVSARLEEFILKYGAKG